ncbi:MAG: hypothetical protein WBP45_10185 [Daejeonella sp.]
MKILKSLLLIALLMTSSTGFSQDSLMRTEVERIKQLGRDSIIKLGLQMVQESFRFNKRITINNFDKITVLANKTSVKVLFSNPIRYVPLNSTYLYDVDVNITGEGLTYESSSNPKGRNYNDDLIPFFLSTKGSEKNTQFVIEALNKDEDEPSTNFKNKKDLIKKLDGSLIIRENKTYYDIERISKYQESFYKIDKKSGKIYDENHNHLIPAPQDEDDHDPLQEYKDRIEGTWLTVKHHLYKKGTGIGDGRIETYSFNNNGHFIYESYILRESKKKFIIKGSYEVDTENKLIFLKLMQEENTIYKPDGRQTELSLPFETVLKYKHITADTANNSFNRPDSDILEINYLSLFKDDRLKDFSLLYDLDHISWNTEIKNIVKLLENKGKKVQITKFNEHKT